ncbi:MAG TPA: HAD family hydrolase [Chthonomonadaceae bacterium]|nr:HAD family hydrolase [Chthonomonadaceae bacterium]
MAAVRCVFIDFDETLNDPHAFHGQFVRAMGSLLAGRFGGDAARWSQAAVEQLARIDAEYAERFAGRPLAGYCGWLEAVRERAAIEMFARMGLPPPPDPAGTARRTQTEALRRCSALYPGAPDAIRVLSEAGYRVHLASGQESEYLAAALLDTGLEPCVGTAYGPDLVDCAKEGREYYDRIFAAADVAPREAVVVDDYPPALGWAMEAGAAAIQARVSSPRRQSDVDGVAAVMTDWRELPALVRMMG